jgi:outer membrane protein, heavy metal efflux system
VRIELEKKRLEDELSAARLDAARALANARALLGPNAASFSVAAFDITQPLGAATSGALDAVGAAGARGDARALAVEAETAQLEEDAAGRALIPEPTLFGGGVLLDLGRPELGFGYTVGVEVPIPLFDNGQGNRARAKARRSFVEAQRSALVHRALMQLDAVQAERKGRAERAKRHDAELVVRANELFEITSAAYRGGGAELLALVDAGRAQREAGIASIDLHLAARESENEALLLAGAYDDTTPSTASTSSSASTKP